MDLKGKKIVVIGMGRTGIETAQFLGTRGALVFVTDEKPREQWGAEFEQMAAGQGWLIVAEYGVDILNEADMVVPSPGVPPHNNILRAAQEKNIPVVSEVELAAEFLQTPIIVITGTNGKTTTTSLLGRIMERSGKKVFVGGNIGNPLIGCILSGEKPDYIVAEISSFQLQWTDKFHPFVAVLLNVTCDHVDYHGSFAEYRRVKAKVFANQTKADFALLNADDGIQKGMEAAIGARLFRFSSHSELTSGIYLKGNSIICKGLTNGEEQYPLSMIKIPGRHNVENVMAAILAARLCGCSQEDIIAAVADFRGLPHRIEYAGEVKGVKFYDDSKGTNVGSVERALQTFTQPVVLLLGGRDKDGDFDTLQPLLAERTKQIVLFGEARDRIESLIGAGVPVEKKEKLREAVLSAYQKAVSGDVVLLSPGCASFDEFKNYKERGDYFKEVVRSL